MNPLLSILTPAVFSRLSALETLSRTIADAIGDNPVEHLVLIDNKRRTVGEKRDALLRAAHGSYVAFVDDDDMISNDYVDLILQRIRLQPDVITFRQQATVNDVTAEVEFRLGNENQPWLAPGEVWLLSSGFVKRNAWHVCAWRRTLAIQSHFPASNYGEDWAFAAPLCKIAKTEEHIAKVIHFYRHSTATTQAPPPTSFPPADTFHVLTGA